MRILILTVLCLTLVLGQAYSQNTNQSNTKVFCNVVKLPNGKHLARYHLPERTNSKTIQKISEVKESTNLKIEVKPNPITTKAEMSFDLNKNSNVNIFAFDNSGKKTMIFKGFLSEGSNSLSFDMSDFDKGLLMLYLEIDGKLFSSKAIKL